MRKLISILTLLMLLGSMSAREQLQYTVHHYSVSDGLSQNTVMAILQDRDGFMWFGTWDGLNRFDGYEFKTYKPTLYGDTPSSNRIDYLYEDSLGYLWMRTYGGAFYFLDKHTDQIIPTNIIDPRFGTSRLRERLLMEVRKGEMWVGGGNNLLCLRAQAGAPNGAIHTRYTLHSDINSLFSSPDGHVWVATEKGLEGFYGDEHAIYAPSENDEECNLLTGCSDGKFIWFGSESGIIWRYSPRSHRFDRVNIGAHSPITVMEVVSEQSLVIATEADGFFLYDKRSGKVTAYNSATTPVILNNFFHDLYVDSHGYVWLENEERGILRFKPHDGSVKRYTNAIDERYNYQLIRNFFAFEDKNGILWVNPEGGGFACYNPQTDSLESRLGGVTNMIHSAYMDRGGTLWLGTYDLGLDRISVAPRHFELYDLRSDQHHSGELRAICQRRDSTLILATKDKRVRAYTEDMEYLETLPVEALVYCMLETADGGLWMGSKNDGLFFLKDGELTNYRADTRPYSLSCNDVYDLCYGPDSTLYIATFGGGINILRDSAFLHEDNDWASYPERFGAKVRNLLFTDDTTLFAATTTGVLRINTRTLETRQTPYFDIRALHQTPDGHLWIGTFGGGLIEVMNPLCDSLFAPDNIHIYNLTNGLVSDIVLSIASNLWIAYESGLSHLSKPLTTPLHGSSEASFQHFSAIENEKGAVFGEAKGLVTYGGQILFGYSYGACKFSPAEIFHLEDVPPIQFTNFLLFNRPVTPSSNGPLSDAICYAPKIHLKHSQSVFSIEYATLAFPSESDDIQYAYMMDGIDADWNYVGTLRRATYTHLGRGNYTFRVRSTNAEGVWVDNERTLSIHVDAPFWLTGWAFLLYIFVLVVLGFALYEAILIVTKLREEVAIEQKVTDIKLRFFTNISHELRTPLTLITGPVENILKSEKLSPSMRSQLQIVQSNSARMLRMINQILDFRKIQNQKMRLKIQQTAIHQLVADTCANFNKEAYDKQITFTLVDEVKDGDAALTVWLDRDKTDTILYNLLSNAFKYTDEGGSITVTIGKRENYCTVTVADTGVGIPKDKRSLLFERFASQNEIHGNQTKTGTGIGLNLVKDLVDLHHGFIEVESEPGKGSAFTVLFPLGKDHFTEDPVDFIVDDSALEATLSSPPETGGVPRRGEGVDNLPSPISSPPTILVVDDNDDMCAFLSSILSPTYHVVTASNGLDALRLFAPPAQGEPEKYFSCDLIVSDLMMPNMDGLDLTNRLKNDPATSHIPIILLTAKSAIESRLQALKYGADDYITKPFSPEYLLARIENILRQREQLRATYRSNLLSLQPQLQKESNPDETFLAHLLDYMEHNMDNSALTVEDLVSEMALGRTVFFNKVKGLTGLSPVEFIREVRIKRAAQLLRSGQYNVTEITYMVGMNDSRYFAKCFKAAYGKTPTDYRKSLNQEE